jgi:nucleoside-diphosphate kinase
MKIEKTLSIIKPDILRKNKLGKVLERFESAGLKIIDMKMLHLSEDMAKKFYAIHSDKIFFKDLVNFMTSGPVIVQVLEGENAIMKNREIMGHTNPKLAKSGTIRYDFASSIDENAVHGSDSPETAKSEIKFFFQ